MGANMIKRFIAAGAFVAVVLLGGCAAGPVRPELSLEHVPATPPAEPPTVGESALPRVNLFGEIGMMAGESINGSESALVQHTASDEGADADVSVDPSCQWLVYSSTRHSESADIYVQRTDGTSVVQLTSDPADDIQPVFSADGSRIAFCSSRCGNWDIFVMDVDGKNVRQITQSLLPEMHPTFSPDGGRLAYCALSRGGQWELWVVDLTTQQRKVIGAGLFPVWSPRTDVDQIAFQRARQRGSRWFSIWTLELANNEPTRLTEVVASSTAALVSPAWSPDGKRLAFSAIVSPARPADGAAGQIEIWACSSDGGDRQRLMHGSGVNLCPSWSVNNRVYFISDRSGHENVWSVSAEAVGATAVAETKHGADHKMTVAKEAVLAKPQQATHPVAEPAQAAAPVAHPAKPAAATAHPVEAVEHTAIGAADTHEVGH